MPDTCETLVRWYLRFNRHLCDMHVAVAMPPPRRQLQKNIVSALKEYSHYTAPELELYEKNFIPHITIARDVRLVKEDLDALRSDCSFRAEIRDITCIFVREQTLKESQNSNNKTIYQL